MRITTSENIATSVRCCAVLVLSLATSASCFGAPIRFDFGNGSVSNNTGVMANVVIANGTPLSTGIVETIDGVQITLAGFASPQAGSTWGTTDDGIGVVTVGQSGGANVQQRIDGPLGESVNFSFDTDVTIDSIRLGNMVRTTGGNEEVVQIAFVSGNDPFVGGSFTTSTSATSSTGPADDIPVGVFVTAGTVLSLTTSVPQNNGVLWNDIVVTPIPEPTAIVLLGLAAALLFARRRQKS
jgi:hypothetical protein